MAERSCGRLDGAGARPFAQNAKERGTLRSKMNEVRVGHPAKNPFLFRDTMLKLIHSDNLEYKELTRAA